MFTLLSSLVKLNNVSIRCKLVPFSTPLLSNQLVCIKATLNMYRKNFDLSFWCIADLGIFKLYFYCIDH